MSTRLAETTSTTTATEPLRATCHKEEENLAMHAHARKDREAIHTKKNSPNNNRRGNRKSRIDFWSQNCRA